jgi:hypothetical protein
VRNTTTGSDDRGWCCEQFDERLLLQVAKRNFALTDKEIADTATEPMLDDRITVDEGPTQPRGHLAAG